MGWKGGICGAHNANGRKRALASTTRPKNVVKNQYTKNKTQSKIFNNTLLRISNPMVNKRKVRQTKDTLMKL